MCALGESGYGNGVHDQALIQQEFCTIHGFARLRFE
jgi:hypothetical protein